MAHFGTVDGVINNAGIIQPFSRLNDLDYAVIERVINVNLLGTLFMTKEFLPFLLQRPEANITNISSMGGFIPFPGQTMYGASKAAVKLMTEGLASELLHTKVHVTVVFPGAVATNISANSGVNMAMNGNTEAARKIRALPAARAAEIILNGIERNARRVFVGRDSALLDKLYRLVPGMAARAIASQMRALLPE
jgi:short-subunit dehydrogenase